MTLIGTFTNKSNKVRIKLNPDKSYSIDGLEGFNTDSGRYWFEDSNVAGYPTYLVLKHSTKSEHILSSGTYRLPIRIINENSFVAMDNYFCEYDFNENIVEATFTKS
jgi:hypothetical protein